MTALTYQKDARAYRFSLPNEIWGLKLPPPAFSILAYLCYLNSHHKGDAVPSVDEIAALLHMGGSHGAKAVGYSGQTKSDLAADGSGIQSQTHRKVFLPP